MKKCASRPLVATLLWSLACGQRGRATVLGAERFTCSSLYRALSGAGREIWDFRSGGKMMHVGTQRCAGVAGSPGAGAQVVPVPCDGAGTWEATPDGQLKAGDFCLSQSGVSARLEDVAHRSAAAASSTFDSVTHGTVPGRLWTATVRRTGPARSVSECPWSSRWTLALRVL